MKGRLERRAASEEWLKPSHDDHRKSAEKTWRIREPPYGAVGTYSDVEAVLVKAVEPITAYRESL